MGRKKRNFRRKGYKSNPFSRAVRIKRIGQLMRIGNSVLTGDPTGSATGGNSLFVGAASADTLNTRQVGASIQFALNSTTDFGDFTNLFDRYKITGIKLKFLYQCNLANADSTTGTNSLPLLSYSFDADDAAVPGTIEEVQRKQYCKQKILNGNYSFSTFIKPRVLKQVYLTGLTDGYNSAPACWIDSAQPGVPHYGLKMWLNNWTPGATKLNQLTITPTYYLALKDTQ